MQWLKFKIYLWVMGWSFSSKDLRVDDERSEEDPMVTIWIDKKEDMIYYETNVTEEMAAEMVEAINDLMQDPVVPAVPTLLH